MFLSSSLGVGMKLSDEINQYINTMLAQIGGRMFLSMMGHKGAVLVNYDPLAVEYTARIRVMGAKDGIRYLDMIYVRGKDLYRFEYRNYKGEVVKVQDELFCEDMEGAVSEATGLATRLFPSAPNYVAVFG